MIPDRANELADVIREIGAEGDEYANIVIPLIERMLADDYSHSGLFEAIDKALKQAELGDHLVKAEPPIASVVDGPICGAPHSSGMECTLPLAHHGLHRATVQEIDPETGEFYVAEEWHD